MEYQNELLSNLLKQDSEELINKLDNKLIKKIHSFDISNLFRFIDEIDDKVLFKIVEEKEALLETDKETFNKIFLRASYDVKMQIIEDDDLLLKLLKIGKNRMKKTFFNFIDDYMALEIIKKAYIFTRLNNKELNDIIYSIKPDLLEDLIINLDNYIRENDNLIIENNLINEVYKMVKTKENIDFIKKQLIEKYNIYNKKSVDEFINNCVTGNRNIFYMFFIENYEQLYIYNKFNIIVDKNIFNESNNEIYNLSIEYLEKLNAKHVIRIMNDLKLKDSDVLDNDKLFIVSVKMYGLFGLDNTLKIINDKFTYSTPKSLKEAAILNYTLRRRMYRIEHQNQFFSYELVKDVKDALEKNDKTVFQNFASYPNDDSYITNLIQEIRRNKQEIETEDQFTVYLTERIKEEINLREDNIKERYTSKYLLDKETRREKIEYLELYDIFKEYDCFQTKFDENNNVIMNQDLQTFLLGNTKSDNSCLLRLVFNEQAMGFNYKLIDIINNFDKIKKIIKKEKSMSVNSILDILDVYKVLQYKLTPDEEDLTLTTLTKLLKSKKYVGKNESEVLSRIKKVHKIRKKKVSSTIPKISGKTSNGIKYKVMDNNDLQILTCGVDTGTCFRFGAIGEDFFKYCLTSKYADIIGLWDENGKFYMCPIIRNGNAIFGNGLDPAFATIEKKHDILMALQECFNKIIDISDEKEKIELATLTNLNDYITESMSFKKFSINENPVLDDGFYCDITKSQEKDKIYNYIICGENNFKSYFPKIEYYSSRKKSYIYSSEQEKDKSIIQQKINELLYTSIDLKLLTENKKNSLKRNFKKINIDDFLYVICNQDWFVAVPKEGIDQSIISVCLPYDRRARQEYMSALNEVSSIYEIAITLEGEKNERKY